MSFESRESATSNEFSSFDERMTKFSELAGRYEISLKFASRLRQLDGFEIVFICDDSSSMETTIQNCDRNSTRRTRWDELKAIVSIVVDLASVLDPDGIDVFFLNRPALLKVKHSDELNESFSKPPSGFTPISRVLRNVLEEKRSQIAERKLLIIIATDGEPTDDSGNVDRKSLRDILLHERKPINRIPVTFCICTEDERSVRYLDKWDRKIPFVDVCDDFQTERDEILKKRGEKFSFSFGDYVVKLLLGSIDSRFDDLDEKTANCKCLLM